MTTEHGTTEDNASDATADADSISESDVPSSNLSIHQSGLTEIKQLKITTHPSHLGSLHIDWGSGLTDNIELTNSAVGHLRGPGSSTVSSIANCMLDFKQKCGDVDEENSELRRIISSLLPKGCVEHSAIQHASVSEIRSIIARTRQQKLLQKISLAKRDESNPLPVDVLVCKREVGRPSSAPPGKITKLDLSTQQACVLRLHDVDCQNRKHKSSKQCDKLSSSFTSHLALTRREQRQLGKRLCTEQLEKSKVINTLLHEKYAPPGVPSRVLSSDEINICNDRLYYDWGKKAASNRQKLFVRYVEDRLPPSKTLSLSQQQQMAERLTKAPPHTTIR